GQSYYSNNADQSKLGTINAVLGSGVTWISGKHRVLAALILAISAPSGLWATLPDAAEGSIRQFLTQDDTQHPYRATRRLEAENGSRTAWLEAVTEYSRLFGFHYTITAEGGSTYISTKILRAVLDGERDVIAQGEAARSSLARSNYDFQPNGVDVDGLANILL